MIIATDPHTKSQVEIIDVYPCGGLMLAVCHCIDGSEPFVGGDKWPVKTDWATIPVCHLENITQVDAPEDDYEPSNL